MIEVKIQSEIEDAISALGELKLAIPKISEMFRKAVTLGAKHRVQNRMGAFLGSGGGTIFGVRSGKNKGKKHFLTLRQRVYGYSRSDTHSVVAAPRYIAEPLEHGTTIKPKKGKYLFFVGSSGYRRAKSVVIPARHWFTRSLAGYEESNEVNDAIVDAEERMRKKFEGTP